MNARKTRGKRNKIRIKSHQNTEEQLKSPSGNSFKLAYKAKRQHTPRESTFSEGKLNNDSDKLILSYKVKYIYAAPTSSFSPELLSRLFSRYTRANILKKNNYHFLLAVLPLRFLVNWEVMDFN